MRRCIALGTVISALACGGGYNAADLEGETAPGSHASIAVAEGAAVQQRHPKCPPDTVACGRSSCCDSDSTCVNGVCCVPPHCPLLAPLSSTRSTASSVASTSTVTDPAGDAVITGKGTVVFAYQDIVKASVTSRDGTFVFKMELAAAIPQNPPLPNGAKLLMWRFGLRTDRTTCASGFPYPPGASTTSPTRNARRGSTRSVGGV